ncbi:MAG: ATP-binding protein [Pseudomonadota bacterium]
MLPNSLALRLLFSSVLWSLLGLVIAGFLLTAVYKRSVESAFDDRLNVYLKILVAAQAEAGDPMRMLAPTLPEPRFSLILSGWYWHLAKADGEIILASRSLFAEELPPIDLSDHTPNEDGVVAFYATGPAENSLRMIARDVIVDGGDPVVIVVAGNASDIQRDIAVFRQRIALTLAALGLVLAISTFVQVRWGLRPLSRIAQGLNDIREGRSEDLKGSFPSEIQTLVSETNALIAFNKKVVERARTHVGNLAHALKTPISVLRNEANGIDTPLSQMVKEQTNAMQAQVNYHLDRAQIIARSGVLTMAHPVKPVIDGLVRVMRKVYGDKGLEISVALPVDLKFAGEVRDLEEALGNLIDNACKWAETKVDVSGSIKEGGLVIDIEDDGPGMTEDEQARAVKRGERLDQEKPGSGLGLSIVRDLVNAYDGDLVMARSKYGGLRATLTFPVPGAPET